MAKLSTIDDAATMLDFLRELLEPYGFLLGPDQCVRLERILRLHEIGTEEAVRRNAGKLCPVVATSAEQQELFHAILSSNPKAADDEGLSVYGFVVNILRATPSAMKPDGKDRSRVYYIVGVLLLVALSLFFYQRLMRVDDLGDTAWKAQPQAGAPDSQVVKYAPDTTGAGNPATSYNQLRAFRPRKVADHGSRGIDTTKAVWGLLAIALALMAMVLAIMSVIEWLRRRRLDRRFAFPKSKVGPLRLRFPNQQYRIDFEGIPGQLGGQLLSRQANQRDFIDIGATIYHTIRRAGFPVIRKYDRVARVQYLVLIDVGRGDSQQRKLFESLLDNSRKQGPEPEVYFYRYDLSRLSASPAIENPVSLDELRWRYGGAALIVIGNGYGLLDSRGDEGTVVGAGGRAETLGNAGGMRNKSTATASLIGKWDRRVLLTPVPRNNWSEEERAIFSILPVFPATERGLALMLEAMKLPDSVTGPMPRDPWQEYVYFPVRSEISEYEKFFADDRRLLVWLYSLAISDTVSWEVTLTAGAALEKDVYPAAGPLVTYSNLLKLTSVEWLQTGMVDTTHRMELVEQLQLEKNGKQIIRLVAGRLSDLLRQAPVEDGTLLALRKKIDEASLSPWLGSVTPAVTYLQQRNWLSGFATRQFAPRIRRINVWRRTRNALLIVTPLVAVQIVIPLIPEKTPLIGPGFMYRNRVDSFAWYNNRACEVMDSGNLIYFYSNARELLENAIRVGPDSNGIARSNRRILDYQLAIELYVTDSIRLALRYFPVAGARGDSITVESWYAKALCYYRLARNDSACWALGQIDSAYRLAGPLAGELIKLSTCSLTSRPDSVKKTVDPPRGITNRAIIVTRNFGTAGNSLSSGSGYKARLIANNNALDAVNRRATSDSIIEIISSWYQKQTGGTVSGNTWPIVFVSWCYNRYQDVFPTLADFQDLKDTLIRYGRFYYFNDSIPKPAAGEIYFYSSGSENRAGMVNSFLNQSLIGIEGAEEQTATGPVYTIRESTYTEKQLKARDVIFFRLEK